MATIDVPLVNSFVVGVHYDEPGKAAATGATAGSPGSFTPVGSEIPEDASEMAGVVASPATAWTAGQHVILGGGATMYWNGTAWTAGVAGAVSLDEMTKAELLEYAKELGVSPANNDMTKEELRAGVDAKLAEP
jgi:hypothetical protein